MKKKIVSVLSICIAFSLACSGQAPFANDIAKFKQEDSLHFPLKNEILFVGSSSFTKWTDVQEYFPAYPIINRGFGGSSLPDVIRYADDIIFPYHPKQIVIYCGENDFAAADTVSVNTVFERFKNLFGLIRAKLPNVPVDYVSMKPSPSRKHLLPKFSEANALIKKFLASRKKTGFIDVYDKMLDAAGEPINGIYVEDNLHMNADGYHIWQKIIDPYLIK